MKFLNFLSLSFILIAVAVLFASHVTADDLSGGIQAPDVQAQPAAPVVKTKVVKKLIGQLYGQYGTVHLYDNGKGYRWAEVKEKAVYTVYGPGQQRRDVIVNLDEPAPVTVTTTRWGKVYTDPRLVAGWIEGE